jgi:hypothetical protein
MATNAFFYHRLQGPTARGRKILAQLREYRKFLAEVDADRVSRTNPSETVPSELNQKTPMLWLSISTSVGANSSSLRLRT